MSMVIGYVYSVSMYMYMYDLALNLSSLAAF